MNKLLGMPDSPYMVAECNGKLKTFMLFADEKAVDETLQELGYQSICGNTPNWRFDTTLPQEIRDVMRENEFQYAIVADVEDAPDSKDGMIYYYRYGRTCVAINLKYLKSFAQENVEIDIDGKTYSYFMTNDDTALFDKLLEHHTLFPSEKDWQPNYALHKNVTDKMTELGAKYSMTFSNGVSVLNRYDGGVPSIIDVDLLMKRRDVVAGFWNTLIKNDDAETLAKLIKDKSDIEEKIILLWTPLMAAACYNSQKCAKLLLELGADVNAMTKDGVTALMIAAGKGSKETVQILLDAGADKRLRTKNGWTAYVHALAYNHEDIAALLAENDSEKSYWQEGKLPFHDRRGQYIARFISLDEHKPCDIYKNLGKYMSRMTFSKLQTKTIHPSKRNVILLAIGLRLSLEDADTLLLSAGYALSDNNAADKVIKEAFQRRVYKLNVIDYMLWSRSRTSLLGKQKGEED